MRGLLVSTMFLGLLLSGCGAAETGGAAGPADRGAPTADAGADAVLSPATPGGGANAFNPYLHERLPNTRLMSAEAAQMLGKLGAHTQSIEGEAAYRAHWRQELYPVVFGDPRAPHEILVLLDFSAPQSEKVWQAVVEAGRSLSPQQCKIVVFGNSRENYGTDLLGLAIWISYSRPGQAMPYLSYALERWNAVKAEQKHSGGVKPFTNEYDATAKATDFPIHYGYLTKLRPPVPAKDELAVAKYCYDAGNVNMYQTVQLCRYYGVKSLPAVVADGKVLGQVSARAIVNAVK
ncbi:hypothetical protein FYJ44_13300 [Desulfovibrio sp. PG-178-WT-4]|uniref:Thioredoxin-like fold domain-containing protein n=1 Tax=Desulfovibrio porci TaxID=2605782 RepID=A0A6L5XP33_9BACT|nr:hypothetical protein [Desulfovibrio porci]MDY3810944.1 hypothetical protein [Desulfovibrio porci]MSS28980.1 hypothetical protein [Desulfovibrio porci]